MRLVWSCLILGSVAGPLAAQRPAPVRYDIAFPNAAHHEAEITVTFPEVPRGPLSVVMSRSSPGRYALHEFAKNIYAVRAEDSRGRPLPVTRPNPYQWTVAEHDGTVRFHYTLFADRADGTYSAVDRSHAHLNMPATFAWAHGLEGRAIAVHFQPADTSWRVASQLLTTSDPLVFTAPSLQYFMDSPTELSDHMVRSWTAQFGDQRRTIRLALHHLGSAEEADRFAALIERVVAQEVAVFGEFPPYEPGHYTFIACYLPWASGDGMEHRNSTILTSSRPLATGMLGNLGTVSHEFFHSWNVERLRPRSLEPFDFERANMSGELWLAEGFTSYYDDLFIRRAAITSVADYAAGLAGTIDVVVNRPGRRFFSPVEMSQQAPFVDAATSVDPQNRGNTFISYYTWGAAIGLALDLTLRGRPNGVTLDDFMRALWRQFGRTEQAYTLEDVERTLAEVSGDRAFAADFFRRYIRGREAPDFAALLAQAGLLLRPRDSTTAWLGDTRLTADTEPGLRLAEPTLIGTPWYQAGLDRDDRLLTLAGEAVTQPADVPRILAARRPGDRIAARFVSRGVTVDTTVTVMAAPRLELVTFEAAGRQLSPAATRFRRAWLGDDR